MIILDPSARYRASECLQQGYTNGLFKRTCHGHVVDVQDYDPGDPSPTTPTQRTREQPDTAAPLDKDNMCASMASQVTGVSWASAVEELGTSLRCNLANVDLRHACRESMTDEGSLVPQEFLSAVEEMPPALQASLLPLAKTPARPPPGARDTTDDHAVGRCLLL